jgi:putative transposase
MLDRHHKKLGVREQCRLLQLNRSTLYYKPKPDDDVVWAKRIHDLWLSTPFYGYRRIWAAFRHEGYEINRKRVQSVMKKMNLRAIYPKRNLSKANAQDQKYPYLLKDLSIDKANMAWCTDITYIKLGKGFAYLVGLIDVYSRYIVSWRISTTLEKDFCLEMLEEALSMAIPHYLNTDQGSQFTSPDWIKRVEEAGALVSMDGKGRWADNIPIERFWRSLKYEAVLLHSYTTVSEARTMLGKYIRFYNEDRPHQSLGYARPMDVYKGTVSVTPFLFKKAS